MNINGLAVNVISLGQAINIHDVYWLAWWRPQGRLHANMLVRFLRDFRTSSILKVNFFMLTKRWALILLSKLSERYAILGK